jgi:hypothetical protein
MSTLAEIETAVLTLPAREQKALFKFLAGKLEAKTKAPGTKRRGLKSAAKPALPGLPADLSMGTRERVRALIASRHGANR